MGKRFVNRLIVFSLLALIFSATSSWAEDVKYLEPPVLSTEECKKAPTDFEYLKSSAELGDMYQQAFLAEKYFEEGHYKEAMRWYRKSAEGGFGTIQMVLGSAYDPDRPRKSPSLGFSSLSMADQLVAHKAVVPDYKEAAKWYGMAAEQGVDEAKLYFTKIKKHLTERQIADVETAAKELKSSLIHNKKSYRPLANVVGILCGKSSNHYWKISDGGDSFLIAGDSGRAWLRFNKLTREITGGNTESHL